MELQNTSPNLTSRESVQRKIANALDYLGENYNIVDKSVREGDATTMDIARSFTGDVKSDKLSENIGLLDFIPLGTYFAAEEGQDAINKAEPNAFKRQMALLNYLRQPLQTIIDRPDIGLPATDIAFGGIEAIPFGYVVTKPIKGFFKSLKAKATEPSKDVGMITQQTSLATSGDVSTTTVPVKNEEINQSRRKFIKDTGTVGTVGALGMLGTQVPDAIKMVEKAIVPNTIKKGPKIMKNLNLLDNAQKVFARPQLIKFLKSVENPEKPGDPYVMDEEIVEILYDRVPEISQTEDPFEFVRKKYNININDFTTTEDIINNKALVNDLLIDVGGDNTEDFITLIRREAINDGADFDGQSISELSDLDYNQSGINKDTLLEKYSSTDVITESKNVVKDFYKSLKEKGLSSNDIFKETYRSLPFEITEN